MTLLPTRTSAGLIDSMNVMMCKPVLQRILFNDKDIFCPRYHQENRSRSRALLWIHMNLQERDGGSEAMEL
jgi:hypothetical protein